MPLIEGCTTFLDDVLIKTFWHRGDPSRQCRFRVAKHSIDTGSRQSEHSVAQRRSLRALPVLSTIGRLARSRPGVAANVHKGGSGRQSGRIHPHNLTSSRHVPLLS